MVKFRHGTGWRADDRQGNGADGRELIGLVAVRAELLPALIALHRRQLSTGSRTGRLLVRLESLARRLGAATAAGRTILTGKGDLHARRDRDEQRHDGNRAFAGFVNHDDGHARLVVDGGASEGDVVVERRPDGLKDAHMAWGDVVHALLPLWFQVASADAALAVAETGVRKRNGSFAGT